MMVAAQRRGNERSQRRRTVHENKRAKVGPHINHFGMRQKAMPVSAKLSNMKMAGSVRPKQK